MNTQWIVVANASLARIFRCDQALVPLVPVEVLTHEQSRLRGSELGTDRDGRQATDGRHGTVPFAPRTDRRRKEHTHFAREIAARLDKGLAAKEFDSVALFSSNPFLGELTAQLSDSVRSKVSAAFGNDFSAFGTAEIEQRLQTLRSAIRGSAGQKAAPTVQG